MDTPLNRVETLPQSGDALYIHQIVKQADITEKAAKASIKTLSSMGQIEVIPTPGRWGNRYAWLAAKPVAVEPPAIPEADLVAGVKDTITGDGSGEALPDIPLKSDAHKAAVGSLVEQMEQFYDPKARAKSATRYAVAVPRRPLRVVKTRARAEALALAAVRRGAKGAEVFALTPVGKARRDATFQEALS